MKRKKLSKKFMVDSDMLAPISFPKRTDIVDNRLNHFEKLIEIYQCLENSGSTSVVTERVKQALCNMINTISEHLSDIYENEKREREQAKLGWQRVLIKSTAVDNEKATGTTPEKSQK